MNKETSELITAVLDEIVNNSKATYTLRKEIVKLTEAIQTQNKLIEEKLYSNL